MGGGEWWGWWVVGVGGVVARNRLYLPLRHESSAVSSVSGSNRLNPQDSLRQSLAADWHH